MALRAVFLAVAVAMISVSGAARAAYQEVWNPPEAMVKRPVAHSHAKASPAVKPGAAGKAPAHGSSTVRASTKASPTHSVAKAVVVAKKPARAASRAVLHATPHAPSHALMVRSQNGGAHAQTRHVATTGNAHGGSSLAQAHKPVAKVRSNTVTPSLSSAQKSSPARQPASPARSEPPIIS